MYCTKCDKTWKFSKIKGFKCSLCKTPFLYQCGRCMKNFELCYALIKHLKDICNVKPKYFCDHCQIKTKEKSDLAKHIIAKHLPRDANKNKCDKCEKVFAYRRGLIRHSKKCGQNRGLKNLYAFKSYCCDHCGYRTYRKDHLVIHIKAHLGIVTRSQKKFRGNSKRCSLKSLKAFSCDDCGYSCVLKMSLVNHMQVKHLNNNFDCTACGKKFGSQYNMKKHVRYNCKYSTDVKRVYCDHCSYKCFYKSDLASHIQAKHMSVRFKCSSCRKSFASQLRLIIHSRRTKCKNKK